MFNSVITKLSNGLAKTRSVFGKAIRDTLSLFRNVDEDLLNQIEEQLILADVGVDASAKICKKLELSYKDGKIKNTSEVLDYLKKELKGALQSDSVMAITNTPTVILVVGVNGSGKTTSIGKLANFFKSQGKRVLLCASDTFRAAAVEQLTIWSERVGCDIVKHQGGADPAAVAFDAAQASVARNVDVLIVDTAGRLQTKANLMKELAKISNVLAKNIPGAPHHTLLVLDATVGQNAISQATLFNEATKVTGLFLAKLDGTAKGGIVVAINDKLKIPVKFVGTGEAIDDVEVFSSNEFVEALFA